MNPRPFPNYLLTRAEVAWNKGPVSDKVYGVAEILCLDFPPSPLFPPVHNSLPCYLCVAFYGRRERVENALWSIATDMLGSSQTPLAERVGMEWERSKRMACAILELRDGRAPFWWGSGNPESVDASPYLEGQLVLGEKKRGGYDRPAGISSTLVDTGRFWLSSFRRIRSLQTGEAPESFQPTPANVITALCYGTNDNPSEVYAEALERWITGNGGNPPRATVSVPAPPVLAPRKFKSRRSIRL